VSWRSAINAVHPINDVPSLSPNARHVLLLYAICDDKDTHLAFPGTPYLMGKTGLAERAIQRAVQELRAARLLELVENRGGKRRYATYRVVLKDPSGEIPPEAREALARMRNT
jgi:hypothetical protein